MEAILEKIDKNTCMLCLQHASNQTGAVNDVKTLVREARKIKPDLYVLIDAVQYAPHGPIDVEEIGADAYAFGPYKAYGVKGIGFAYISERLAKLPHENLLLKPDTNWVLGSPPHAMFAAWSAVVDYLCWLGGRFTDSTDRRELIVASKKAIFLFRLEGIDSSTASEHYNQKHRVRVSARVRDAYSTAPLEGLGWPDAVRLSAAHYNTPEEIDLFLKATKAFRSD
jgi:selenocysteine lyase/cysteine desulfurase